MLKFTSHAFLKIDMWYRYMLIRYILRVCVPIFIKISWNIFFIEENLIQYLKKNLNGYFFTLFFKKPVHDIDFYPSTTLLLSFDYLQMKKEILNLHYQIKSSFYGEKWVIFACYVSKNNYSKIWLLFSCQILISIPFLDS